MKTILKTTLLFSALAFELIFSQKQSFSNESFNELPSKQLIEKISTKANQINLIYEYENYDYSIFVSALVYVESRNNTTIVNKKTGASGIFQQMKIQIDDANRIIKKQKYCYDDRFDVKKSTEIFYIIQNHYNKKLSIRQSIKLHNPKAGFWYYVLIYDKMKKIKNGDNKNS